MNCARAAAASSSRRSDFSRAFTARRRSSSFAADASDPLTVTRSPHCAALSSIRLATSLIALPNAAVRFFWYSSRSSDVGGAAAPAPWVLSTRSARSTTAFRSAVNPEMVLREPYSRDGRRRSGGARPVVGVRSAPTDAEVGSRGSEETVDGRAPKAGPDSDGRRRPRSGSTPAGRGAVVGR